MIQLDSKPVLFVWPGDLHLENDTAENWHTAQWMVDEVNALIRPDFVQFAGDNVQHATESEFDLFGRLCERLTVPFHVLAGDHDVHHDPNAQAFRAHLGDPRGAFSVNGYRFIRLNTVESRPLGLSPEQTCWFRWQVDDAAARGQQVVVFQHHYPYQIWEDFDGPGIDQWRSVVQTRRVAAIFSGHTHYGQIANDGRNVCVATRSIGEPEGGAPGYAVVYLNGQDLAVRYRTRDDDGPFVMITRPRASILATHPVHVVSGTVDARVHTWSATPITQAEGKIDDHEWFELQPGGDHQWTFRIDGTQWSKGTHQLEIRCRDSDGLDGRDRIDFQVDLSGRYTAVPRLQPEVHETRFC